MLTGFREMLNLPNGIEVEAPACQEKRNKNFKRLFSVIMKNFMKELELQSDI